MVGKLKELVFNRHNSSTAPVNSLELSPHAHNVGKLKPDIIQV